jgi:hypothetical protein
MAKYRHRKVKRQHHVLPELEDGLALLAQCDAVAGIIPGIIKPKSGDSIGFSFQYLTASGLKLIGRSGGAAQEIFVITHDPERVLQFLADVKLIQRADPPRP